MQSPSDIYRSIKNEPYSFLLESPNGNNKLESYSFIGFDPACIIESRGRSTNVTEGEKVTIRKSDPFDILKEYLDKYRHLSLKNLRFNGGAVGWISYDAGRLIEKLPDIAKDDLLLPSLMFMIPRKLAIFDHQNNKVISNFDILTSSSPRPDMASGLPSPQSGEGKESRRRREEGVRIRSNMTKDHFKKIVLKAKEYIRNGDIYQVNLSQRFEADIDADPFDIYMSLRRLNPSPFASYLNFGNMKLVSCSPERLILLENGIAASRPIAGTRPRGKDKKEDRELKGKLLLNEKERAEHIMLVDLERNDLGRVCDYNSVKVDEMMTVEKYSHVMHIVSNVTGKLRKDSDQFDLLKAVFPGGTITGCPKIRSMEIIEELEPVKRGPYTGTIGYFGFNGNMDMSITIRTIVMKSKIQISKSKENPKSQSQNKYKAYMQVGAGIVIDSVPEFEYHETVNKGKALFEAIRIAEGAKNVSLV
ncbi:MAG: anthranilate synthase component I family protein [bacterium]